MAGKLIYVPEEGLVVVPIHHYGPFNWKCVVHRSEKPYYHQGDPVILSNPLIENGTELDL